MCNSNEGVLRFQKHDGTSWNKGVSRFHIQLKTVQPTGMKVSVGFTNTWCNQLE